MLKIPLEFVRRPLVDEGAFLEEEDGGEEGEDLGGGLEEGEDGGGLEVGGPSAENLHYVRSRS